MSSPRTAALVAVLANACVPAAAPHAPAAAPTAACPGDPLGESTGWTASSTAFDADYRRQPFVGNGYLGTPRYTGAFVAGLYARTDENPKNRQVIAAIPTWTALAVTVGRETLSPTVAPSRISRYRQTLFLRCGLVRTSFRWTTADDKATDVVVEVIAHRRDAHMAAVRLRMRPRWSGRAGVTDLLDGAGARRVAPAAAAAPPDGSLEVAFTTETTGVLGAVASTVRYGDTVHPSARPPARVDGLTAARSVDFPVRAGEVYELVKYVGVDTALTATSPRAAALAASRAAARSGWREMLASHAAAWRALWRGDIEIARQPELQAWVRAAQYSLLASARADQAASIAPTGLSSDDYGGMIFWDAETWMFPALLLSHAGTARSLLEYRCRTMPAARRNAARLGYRGTFYPWTSASAGDLEAECRSGPAHCLGQIHLQGDVALAAWQYYLATGDRVWLARRGWPLLEGAAEFWASRVTANPDGSDSIRKVAGPDEYSNDVDDGVFTNAGAVLALRHATRAARILGHSPPPVWLEIADKIRIPFDRDRQVFVQHQGFTARTIKQADTVLLLYPLEWPMTSEAAARTLDFYMPLTDPDGPAMTDSVHAIDAAAIGEPGCATYTYLMRSIRPFVREPFAQFAEARGARAGAEPSAGAPAFSFHTGSAGFLQVFSYGLAGLRWREDRLHLDPMLPPQLAGGVTLRAVRWRGRALDIAIGPRETVVTEREGRPMRIETRSGTHVLRRGRSLVLATRRPDLTPTSNAARCAPARASSEEPGLHAEAAVDGSLVTAWRPHGATGTLEVDLARATRIDGVHIAWTEQPARRFRLLASLDGARWTELRPDGAGRIAPAVAARHLRVVLESAESPRAGIRELEVTATDQ